MIIDIMSWRMQELTAAYRGLMETGVLLVASSSGQLRAAGFTDDPGLYAIVPALARMLHLSVDRAYGAFVLASIASATIVGLAGFFTLTRSALARVYATAFALVLAFGAVRIADVYTVCFALPFASVPWILALARNRTISTRFLALMPPLGMLGAASHLIRSQSATSMALFTLLIITLWIRDGWKRKAASLALLAVGAAAVLGGFSLLIDSRDAYLTANLPGYERMPVGHPFWHNTYLGLAYLPNPYVSAWSDEVAAEKASELAPGAPYVSDAYEAALRGEVLRILREDPLFVLRTLAAKLSVEIFRAMLVFGLGLLALIRRRPPQMLIVAFVAAIAFEALPALLTVPFHAYMLGLYVWTALFSITCVATAMQLELWPAGGTPTGPQGRS